MKNYKIIINYDGTKYSGWQKQGNTENTIQNKFEQILLKMTGEKAEIFASGRTDAGVHAKYQVANFKIDTDKTDEELLDYINQYLPKDISVISIEQVNMKFHSRLSAKSKTYVYRIHNSKISNIFERNFIFQEREKLDLKKMRESSKNFLGERDFFAFSTGKKTKKSTIRIIYSIDILEKGEEIQIIIRGNGFLYNMVRIMVGTLYEIGLGKRENNIEEIFNKGERKLAGMTMPACGLCLENVEY